jgi:hypothetical protein
MDFQRPAGLSGNGTGVSNPGGRRSLSQKLYTVGVALVLAAVVAVGFGLSYLAYAHLAANGATASAETLGELWDGSTP